jgi:hypothetical protein
MKIKFFVGKYKNCWAMYDVYSKCPVMFGPKKRLLIRLEQLNQGK